MSREFKHGFLYEGYRTLIEFCKKLNIVEYFKDFATSKTKAGNNFEIREKRNRRIATDIFIVLKWMILVLFWAFGLNDRITEFFVWYLIVSNIYTYFYYHTWDKESLKGNNKDWDSLRRRFFNLLIAISFSEFCFAYLYSHQYLCSFGWSKICSVFSQSIWFSISNSLAANYDLVKINLANGYSITMIQLLITFVFVTIIVSNSIPQNSEE